jgi:hypothetical protein
MIPANYKVPGGRVVVADDNPPVIGEGFGVGSHLREAPNGIRIDRKAGYRIVK